MVTEKDKKFISQALILAEDSGGFGGSKLAAIAVFKGEIIGVGVNCDKKHPLAKKFQKNKHTDTLHAEVSCIIKTAKRVSEEDWKKVTLYIGRVKKIHKGSHYVSALAKPCIGCQKAVEAFGIRKVVWSGEGEVGGWGIGGDWD